MDHRLLIVGGTGFVGRNLVLSALEKGFKIVVLSLNKPSSQQKVEGVDYLQKDLTKPIKTSNKLTEIPFDYVVNLSGYIDHSRFLEGGHALIKAHFEGVQNLLQWLDWTKLKRFVQIGSSDEYGNHPPPQHEEMRETPISPYSLGKVASTQFLQMLHRTQSFPAVILRLFLTYGPGQDTSTGNLMRKRFFPATIQGCLSDDPFPTTAGEQLRDFCYVDDIAQGILATLTNEQVNGEIINLASGNPVTIRHATELIQKTLGRGTPEFGKIPYRVGENMALYADTSKAKRILDWKPVVTFEEGVERTVDEYLARIKTSSRPIVLKKKKQHSQMINLSKPSISNLEIRNVQRVLNAGYLGMGPKVKQFEDRLSAFFNRQVVSTANGTSALHIAMQAINTDRSRKDEVLVPSLTYVASYQAIRGAGLKPISCDINPLSLNICLKDIQKKFNSKTLAIMPVHYSGDPSEINKIYAFARKKKIRVVEDAAHAFGSMFNNKMIGSFGDVACFSFDPIKNITCGEGGALVTNDKKIIERSSDIRTLGIVGDSKRRYLKKRTWSFDILEQGYRYHMSDINAAIGIIQLKRFPSFQRKRRKLAKTYDRLLLDSPFIKLFDRNYDEITPHIYVVSLKQPDSRSNLQEHLLNDGIQTGVHYYPNHLLTLFKRKGELLPKTENIYPSLLTLPLHNDLTKMDISFIANSIESFYHKRDQ